MCFMELKTSQRSLDYPGRSKTHHSPPEANQKKNYGPQRLYMLHKAILSIHSAPETTADTNVMIQYLKDTGHRFSNLKKNKIKLGELMLMLDNARPHSAHETQAFLVHRDIQPLKQPAYSPDLNLCDRFLFSKIKHRLQALDFEGNEDVKDCMPRVVRSLPEDELFQQLKNFETTVRR